MTRKASLDSSNTSFEKRPAEYESKSFNDRLDAIGKDKTLSEDQKWAALIGISDHDWIRNYKPPLFVAALSLDKAEVKAAAVEAALRAGADPNELDHDMGKMRNHGRVLAFFVNWDLHYKTNGNLDGMVNNLTSIEILLHYGADPRLDAPFIGPQSALLHLQSARDNNVAPDFYKAAGRMLEKAAMDLDSESLSIEEQAHANGQIQVLC